jgi:hypothetical protein
METLLLLNKNTFTILAERKLQNFKFITPPLSNENPYSEIIELIKDLVQLNNLLKPSDDYVIMKLDTGKVVIYRQNPSNNLAVVLICEKKSYKKQSLTIISKILLDNLSYDELTQQPNFKVKDFGLQSIEELTTKFIDYLRSNKLFPKFFYFNYNPNASNSIQSKKTQLESKSVILYNSSKEYDQVHEQKDTLLQKSTIKEKELNIDLDKKPNNPTKKKIFIKKYNNIKLDQLKKKTFSKSLNDSYFIEKYFLTNNNMIHMLFNNVFIESPNEGNSLKENLNFPINQDNDHVLLFLLDLYDKAQQMFGVSKNGQTEYLDIVNYIELNLSKPEVLLTKNKLAFIKYKSLFIAIQIEIYEDKNYWTTINANTNFYKEIESLFSIIYNSSYDNGQ